MNFLLLPEKGVRILELEKKLFLNSEEAKELAESRPKPRFIWNIIKDRSFGFIFGPSGSGKSTFAENIAFHLCMGSKEFLGHQLDGQPRRVLHVNMEEKLEERNERNERQKQRLKEKQRELINKNYMFQGDCFPTHILQERHWDQLKEVIRSSQAEVVILDSITRMNPGQLERSCDAEKLCKRLRNLTKSLCITLIGIHHTPKIGDQPMTIDTIKGSSTFAQEADFAIGIRETSPNSRYMKNVKARYDSVDDIIYCFKIDQYQTVISGELVKEQEILMRSDQRREDTKRLRIQSFFDKNPSKSFKTKTLVDHFTTDLSIKKRQIIYYLKEAVESGKVVKPKKGHYQSSQGSEINPNDHGSNSGDSI